MSAEEIVRGLRCYCGYPANRADVIWSRVEVVRLEEAISLIESQATEIDELKAQLSETEQLLFAVTQKYETSVKMHGLTMELLNASQQETRTARNELCLKCGLYRDAHKGACDGCRWKEI